jgi:hypothetical protein
MNPELRRNFRLELTRYRLVAMPAVLLLVFAMFVAAEGDAWPPVLYSAAVALFVLLVHLWGARQAGEAVSEEVRERTWDWQRLSALTPWQMAWGKLAGATALTWLGGIVCLLAMGVAAARGAGRGNGGWLALSLVASGIALHGTLLAASLQAARKDSRLAYRLGALMLLPALVVAAVFLFLASRTEMGSVSWYGEAYASMQFVALTSVAFAAWAVLGAYRQMCSELRVRTVPWAWLAFSLFASAYIAGFAPSFLDRRPVFLVAALYTSIILTYYALFTDRITAMSLRRLVVHVRAGQWRRGVAEAPMLASTLLLAIALACAAPWAVDHLPLGSYFPVIAAYPIASVLFLVRDVGLLVFFALARKPGRVEGVTLLYIVLLGWILPGLLRAVGLGPLATALMPIGRLDGWQAALVVAAQVAIMWTLVAWRWRRAFGMGAKV